MPLIMQRRRKKNFCIF